MLLHALEAGVVEATGGVEEVTLGLTEGLGVFVGEPVTNEVTVTLTGTVS
jgi:hypothetical protein